MIGGIPRNFNRGFQLGNGDDFILEGDEYDTAFFEKTAKFLHYLPEFGIITSIEYDHADIYKSLEEIKTAFRRFVNIIPRNGYLTVCGDDENVTEVAQKAFCTVETFGIDPGNAWRAENIRYDNGMMRFDVYHHNSLWGNIALAATGRHNVKNALAVIAVAARTGIVQQRIAEALQSFEGVKRRLELKGQVGGIEIYDDFGHHPTAIKETLDAFRLRFPNDTIWALYEPRSATTRRSIFQKEFVNVFDSADHVLLAPVNQPNKVGADGLFSPEQLARDLSEKGKSAFYMETTAEMVDYMVRHLKNNDKVVTFSNGPFDKIHEKLIDALKINN